MWRIGCVAALAWVGCLGADQAPCDDGVVCASPRVCRPLGGGCADADRVAACVGRAAGDDCSLGDDGTGQCRQGVCEVFACGDGVVDRGEACDLGAANSDNGACTTDCQAATCGDALVWLGMEDCDQGLGNGPAFECTDACRTNVCGDGRHYLGNTLPVEACDDGNADDGDACLSTCVSATCGDGEVQAAVEACDDGGGNGDDRACLSNCVLARCGDARVQLGVEACDDGNTADDDACLPTCEVASCGDGKVHAGVEACDDGNTGSGDGCRSDCAKIEVCSDGILDAGEACDDGEGVNRGDGCADCALTPWSATALTGGDNLATSTAVARPVGLAVDPSRIDVADDLRHRVWRIDRSTGLIRAAIGTGVPGFAGDGGPAHAAALDRPLGVARDGLGNLYVVDHRNHRIRRVDAATGIITTVAGSGPSGLDTGTTQGDGGPAKAARLDRPVAVAVDGLGNLFIAQQGRIRRVDGVTGVISNFAGGGGSLLDGIPAPSAQLQPEGVAVDPSGRVLITTGRTVRRIDPATSFITTIAGTGGPGAGVGDGDGGPALAAELADPRALAVTSAGDIYVACVSDHRVRRIDATLLTIHPVAGLDVNGNGGGFSGDGGLATLARLSVPNGLAVDDDGAVWISDAGNQRVRAVAIDQTIDTVAGTGDNADVALATGQPLGSPTGLAMRADGTLGLYDRGAAVYTVDPSGTLAPAGTLRGGPGGVAFALDGSLRVALADEAIVVDGAGNLVAGNNSDGYSGDGGPADQAALSQPLSVAVGVEGDLWIADSGNGVTRHVDPTGTIGSVPVASLHVEADRDRADVFYAWDGQFIVRHDLGERTTEALIGSCSLPPCPAEPPLIDYPLLAEGFGVAANGDLLIADAGHHQVLRVDLNAAKVTVLAGDGTPGRDGDGGDAILARLQSPTDALEDAEGRVYVSDDSGRVRRIDPGTGIITTVAGAISPEGMGSLGEARLGDARAIATEAGATLVAAGAAGVALTLRASRIEAAIGRYPQDVATADLARFRTSAFGDVGGVALDMARGRAYVAETGGHAIHEVTIVDPNDVATWTLRTLAGNGSPGHADGPLAGSRFRLPSGLALDGDTLYVADSGNHVVRAIDLVAETIATIAGTPETLGFFGDGGLATSAFLYEPAAVISCGDELYLSDTGNHRVRRIDALGTITTVLGDGVPASSGEGAPSAAFPVDTPTQLACDTWGNLLVTSSDTVRRLAADADGLVDGTGPVVTLYGASPRTTYPASATACLTGLALRDDATAWLVDACAGLWVELARDP